MCIQLQHDTIITENGFNDGIHYYFRVRIPSFVLKSPFLVDAPPFLRRHVFLSMLPNRDFPWWQRQRSKVYYVARRPQRGHYYCLKTWGSHHLEAPLQIKINASKQFRIFAVESSIMAFFTVRCQMGSTSRNMGSLSLLESYPLLHMYLFTT